MGFMEKRCLEPRALCSGRKNGAAEIEDLRFFYREGMMKGFSLEDQMLLYGILGGTPCILRLNRSEACKENITDLFLMPTGYLYEEPMLLSFVRKCKEPSVYYSIMEAIASGAVGAK